MNNRFDALLTKEDLKYIESVLYEVKERELTARQVLRVNNSFPTYAREIGYDYYSKNGSAKLLAYGAGAKDVPFVGEDGGRITHSVYDIVSGIKFNRSDLESFQARNTLGKGGSIQIDRLRIETARRLIAEKENSLVFVGDSSYGIQGLLNATGITSENVAQGATGADAPAKRLWSNKTPKEILKDLITARTTARQGGLFMPDTLVLPPEQYDLLDQPYSDTSTMTIRQWLTSQGVQFQKVLEAKELDSVYNGLSVDALLVLDSSPMVVELAVTRDLELLPPVYDILQGSEQVAIESTAGAIIRHPSAIYVGKGI